MQIQNSAALFLSVYTSSTFARQTVPGLFYEMLSRQRHTLDILLSGV